MRLEDLYNRVKCLKNRIIMSYIFAFQHIGLRNIWKLSLFYYNCNYFHIITVFSAHLYTFVPHFRIIHSYKIYCSKQKWKLTEK